MVVKPHLCSKERDLAGVRKGQGERLPFAPGPDGRRVGRVCRQRTGRVQGVKVCQCPALSYSATPWARGQLTAKRPAAKAISPP